METDPLFSWIAYPKEEGIHLLKHWIHLPHPYSNTLLHYSLPTEFIIIQTSTLHFEILFHIIICGENDSGGGTIRGWSWEVFTGTRCDYIESLMGSFIGDLRYRRSRLTTGTSAAFNRRRSPGWRHNHDKQGFPDWGASAKWALGAQFPPLPHYLFLTHPPTPPLWGKNWPSRKFNEPVGGLVGCVKSPVNQFLDKFGVFSAVSVQNCFLVQLIVLNTVCRYNSF